MLTVFTEDEAHPMLLFVFDKAVISKSRIIKKFLLQIDGEEAPEIDEQNKTVKVESSDGQLMLQSVFGVTKVEGIGGGNGKNSVINGVSCQDKLEQNFWGRVELSSPESPSDDMLNVIYVSDRGSSELLKAEPFVGLDAQSGATVFKGARLGGSAAMFASSIERICLTAKFTVPGDGEVDCHIGGLLGGEWTVAYGNEVKALTVTEESGLLTFRAPAGVEITVYM